MKDKFWKIFAVAALFAIIGVYALSTRYYMQRPYVIDRWTGEVYLMRDRLKK